MDYFSLRGRIALLTGATGGIGRATALLFAEAGATLLLSSNDATGLQRLCSDLMRQGVNASALWADLADPFSVESLAATASQSAVDILVCNGGIEGHTGPMLTATEAAIETLLQVNLRSSISLTSALAPRMAKSGRGSIVLIGSIAGLRGNKGIGLYGVAKAGLAQLARNLAVEFGPDGVRANSVSPGLIRTPFARSILEDTDYLGRRLGLTPLRRPGTPDEVAAAILFLASDAGGFITGHNLVVDGGTLISDGN